MSRADFCNSTVEEFEAICKAWNEAREELFRAGWERTRMAAFIGVQPHLSRTSRLTPEKLMPLPWDHNSGTGDNPDEHGQTPEERKERFKELTSKLGEKY